MKERIVFFGAWSEPIGMDAIDRHLAKATSTPLDKSLDLRGREDEILKTYLALNSISNTLEGIYGAYKKTWQLAYPKLSAWSSELQAWKNHRAFVLGGGSLVTKIRDYVRKHPGWGSSIAIQKLEQPDDLRLMNGEGGTFIPTSLCRSGLWSFGTGH